MKIGPIIGCVFIFLFFAVLLSVAVISVMEAIEAIVTKIRKRKYKKTIEKQNKINRLSPNQIRAILGLDPINHPKYKTAREMLENWPYGCPKPNLNEIRKYFGFPLKEEKNDRN